MKTLISKLKTKLPNSMEFRSFEAEDDAELCTWIDYIHNSPYGFNIGLIMANRPIADYHLGIIKEFEEKHNAKCFIVTKGNIQNVAKEIMNYVGGFVKINGLIERNLSKEEATQFVALVNKISPTEQDIADFDTEMESDIPFEGGFGFFEAITALKSI